MSTQNDQRLKYKNGNYATAKRNIGETLQDISIGIDFFG